MSSKDKAKMAEAGSGRGSGGADKPQTAAAPLFDLGRDHFLSSLPALVSREDYKDEDSYNKDKSKWEDLALYQINEKADSVRSSVECFRQHLIQTHSDKATGQCSLLQKLPKASMLLKGRSSDPPEAEDFDQAHFLLKFIRAGNHNIDTATEILLQFLKLAKNNPSYFRWVSDLEVIRKVMKQKFFLILPHRDKFGRRVHIVRTGLWEPRTVSFEQCFSTAQGLVELASLDQKTQVSGLTMIFDCKNSGFKQFRNVSLDNIRVAATFNQEAFPIWIRQTHIINAPMVVNTCYNLVYPFLTDHSKETVIFHNDLASLHKYVDPEILPSDYGGTQGTADNLEEMEALETIHQYLQQEAEYVSQGHNI